MRSLLWRRFLPNARIRVRIVAAVVLAMTVVLLGAAAFVFWRVSFALDRQLNQDLRAYSDLVTTGVAAGEPLPSDKPGEAAQTYATDGTLLAKSDAGVRRLLAVDQVAAATRTPRRVDLERLIPVPGRTPYRVRYFTVGTPSGTVVVAAAISRHKHDEALRELLLQLALADLATIAAAGLVGWGATRAALDPVERYRRAAAAAGGNPGERLPVDTGHDDELTRLGTTLNSLLGRIEEGRRRERQFLADASHELRSPLALLAAEVEWARHRPRTPEEIDTVLRSVGDQTQRLAALADSLLDLEEASSDAPPQLEETPLRSFLQSVVDRHGAAARASGRRIDVEAEESAALLDPTWMGLAVGNLVGNALKHGAGTITVRGSLAGETLGVEVVDEGSGIPAELDGHAFDRFSRADRARTVPGNGLGLAIVAAVAGRHGGRARVVPGGVRMDLPQPSRGSVE